MMTRRALIAGAAMLAAPHVARAAKPKMVITGDMGRVGSRMGFLAEQFEIVGIDRRRGRDQEIWSEYRDKVTWMPEPMWMQSIPDPSVEAVLHLAWEWSEPRAYHNVGVTRIVLDSMGFGDKKFIFASSAQADPPQYGGTRSLSDYGRSKLLIEQFLATHHRPSAAIRFGNVHHADSPPPPPGARISGYGPEINMTDADLRGLMKLALDATEFKIIGPFDAR